MTIGHSGNPCMIAEVGPSSSLFEETVLDLAPITWIRLNEGTGLVAVNSGSEGTDLDYSVDAFGSDVPPSSAFTGEGTRAKNLFTDIRAEDTGGNDVGRVSTGAITVEFAIKITDGESSFSFINTNIAEPQYKLFASVGSLHMQIQTSANTYQSFGIGLDFLSNYDEWIYISVTYDETTMSMKLNNGPEVTAAIAVTIFTGSTSDFNIAADTTEGQGSQAIEIDEFQVYDKILTPTERTLNYNAWATGSA